MKISAGNLDEALLAIGRNPEARDILLAALRKIDDVLAKPDFDVREMVTGPVADAMHVPNQEVTKSLQDGTVITTRYTSKIIRDFILAEATPDHVWEPQTTRALLTLAATAKTVVIGGAYIGDQAVLMGKIMKGRGVIHCFEPSDASADLLERNAAANGLDNIVVNRVGLWSQDQQRLVLIGDDSHAHPELAKGEEAGSFPTASIDGYAARKGIEGLDIILLDIEGAETDALNGAAHYLSQAPDKAPAVIFEIHASYTDWSNGIANTDIVKLLTGFGYHVFALRDYNSNVPMAGRAVELVDLNDIWLEGPPHGFNMIAVKRLSVLQDHGFRTVAGVSPKLLKHRDPKRHAPLY